MKQLRAEVSQPAAAKEIKRFFQDAGHNAEIKKTGNVYQVYLILPDKVQAVVKKSTQKVQTRSVTKYNFDGIIYWTICFIIIITLMYC